MVLGHADVVQELLELVVEAVGLLVVGRLVGEVDVAVAVDRDPVLGQGQVLGGQPEVDGVLGDLGQAKWGASLVSFGSSPFIASAFDLPIIWMLPAGHS